MQIARCQGKESFGGQASRFNSVKRVGDFPMALSQRHLQKVFLGSIHCALRIRIRTGLRAFPAAKTGAFPARGLRPVLSLGLRPQVSD